MAIKIATEGAGMKGMRVWGVCAAPGPALRGFCTHFKVLTSVSSFGSQIKAQKRVAELKYRNSMLGGIFFFFFNPSWAWFKKNPK